MNISEAAKAARRIFEVATTTPMYGLSPADEVNAAHEIQRAIDAETAAKDAEIRGLRHAILSKRDAMENLREEKAELVEALKKIAEHASNHDAYALKDMAIEALRKVGAE